MMTKVFIGGSRRIIQLNVDVCARLDRIVEQGFTVLVGDAGGADKAVQQYLHGKNHQNVEVFCSGDQCRNNVGGWPLRAIEASGSKNREFFTVKDRVMTKEATVGLMLWDGKSLGTINNVARLLGQGKTTLVYNEPQRTFHTIKSTQDWQDLLAICPVDVQQKVEKPVVVATATVTVRQPAQTSLW